VCSWFSSPLPQPGRSSTGAWVSVDTGGVGCTGAGAWAAGAGVVDGGGVGFGVGFGCGAGLGCGVGFGLGAGAGVGVGAVGAGVGVGSGFGAGVGFGFGVGFGLGRGVVRGTDTEGGAEVWPAAGRAAVEELTEGELGRVRCGCAPFGRRDPALWAALPRGVSATRPPVPAGRAGITIDGSWARTPSCAGSVANAWGGKNRGEPFGFSSAPRQKYPDAAAEATRQDTRRAPQGILTDAVSRRGRTFVVHTAAGALAATTVFFPSAFAR
jgi:hypothetical protein